jgi:hypothetical protein
MKMFETPQSEYAGLPTAILCNVKRGMRTWIYVNWTASGSLAGIWKAEGKHVKL